MFSDQSLFFPLIIIFSFIFLIVIAVVIAMMFFDPVRNKMKELGGKVNWRGIGIFPVAGKEVCLEYSAGSRNSPSYLRIWTTGMFGADLVIRPERREDELYKRIGLNREIQVGDKEVDDKLFLECDVPEFAKQLFNHPEIKQMILEITGEFYNITITRDRCVFIRQPFGSIKKLSNEALIKLAQRLLAFAGRIPQFSPVDHPEIAVFKVWRAGLYVIGFGALTCGLFSFFWAIFLYRIVDSMLLWGVAILVSLIILSTAGYLAFQKIKGFSSSSRVFSAFLWTFGIGIVLLSRFGFAIANGALDHGPEQRFERVIIDKYITVNKSTTTHHVVAQHWRKQGRGWEFEVSENGYHNIQPGKTRCLITTKPGRFGFEWVVSENIL